MKKMYILTSLLAIFTLTLTSCKNDFNHFTDFDKELVKYNNLVTKEDYLKINDIKQEFINNNKDKDFEVSRYTYTKEEEKFVVSEDFDSPKKKNHKTTEIYTSNFSEVDYSNSVIFEKGNVNETLKVNTTSLNTTSNKDHSSDTTIQIVDNKLSLLDNNNKMYSPVNVKFIDMANTILPYDNINDVTFKENDTYYVDNNVYTILNEVEGSKYKAIKQIVFDDNKITILDIKHYKYQELDGAFNQKEVTDCSYIILVIKDKELKQVNTKGYIYKGAGDLIV